MRNGEGYAVYSNRRSLGYTLLFFSKDIEQAIAPYREEINELQELDDMDGAVDVDGLTCKLLKCVPSDIISGFELICSETWNGVGRIGGQSVSKRYVKHFDTKFANEHFLSCLTSKPISKQRLQELQNEIVELMEECKEKNSSGRIVYPAYRDTTIGLADALFLVTSSLQRCD